MQEIQILTAATVAVIFFVFGLDNFSKEIQKISGERFRHFLGRATNLPLVGVLIGALVTAVVQSSSATSVIAIGLVNAGVLSFQNSVGIIFGSNIGTTLTAQLVAFKLTSFAPLIIIVGFFLSLIRSRYTVFAKSMFYFGFVFFALNMISSELQPLQNDPRLVSLLTQSQNPFFAILAGCVFTAVVQSSSVTTGLAVILTQQGILSLENAVPLMMGANIGTTATAALAMFSMDTSAKKTALCHFLFNFGGVLICLPFLGLISSNIHLLSEKPAVALANFHLIFNVSTTLVFLVFLRPFTRMVDGLLGAGKMDFERLDISLLKKGLGFDEALKSLKKNEKKIFRFLEENYNMVTLAIETNYRGVYSTAEKRIEYVDFLRSELTPYFARVAADTESRGHSRELLGVVTSYDYLFQIHDSIRDLLKTKKSLEEGFIEIKSDLLVLIRDLSANTLALFKIVGDRSDKNSYEKVKKEAVDLQTVLNEVNQEMLQVMAAPGRNDAGALIHIVTYSQRLKDKLVNYYKLHRGEKSSSTH